jgi:translocation and assembly module TamA
MRKIRKIIMANIAIIGMIYALKGYSASPANESIIYQIDGLTGFLATPVKTRLANSLQSLPPVLTPETIHHWYQQTPTEIQKALSPYGYFKPTIKAKLIHENRTWCAYYQITPGPLLKISQVKIVIHGAGVRDSMLKKLIAQFPLHVGDSFLSEHYVQAKENLLTTAVAEGYLSSYFSQHEVLVDQQTYTATLNLILDTGPRYYFGPIVFQQSILKDSFLRRYIPFQTGDPYSSAQLLKLQTNLNNSGYFQHILISDLVPKKQNQHIPIIFTLTPRPVQQYLAGVGYSTDVGVRGTLGWESRYLNQFGHKLSVISQLSKVQRSLQTSYIIPGTYPNTDSYTINFAVVRKDLAQVASTTQQIGIGSISQWQAWQRNLFLNYQIERFNYINTSTTGSHLLTPGIIFSRNQFDNPIFALHGYRFNMRFQGADKDLLSSASFLQTQLQTKYIMSWNENSRFLLRSDIGYTWAPNPTNFPPSLLFYAGGSQSIRGYDYQALGPGRYLLVASAEYQQRLLNNFYAALFFDAGNAVNNLPISLQKGTGVGLVWASALGPMELTVGKALDLPNRPLRLQFSLGIDLL